VHYYDSDLVYRVILKPSWFKNLRVRCLLRLLSLAIGFDVLFWGVPELVVKSLLTCFFSLMLGDVHYISEGGLPFTVTFISLTPGSVPHPWLFWDNFLFSFRPHHISGTEIFKT